MSSKQEGQVIAIVLAVVLVLLLVFFITMHQLADGECKRAGFDAGYYKTTFRNDLHIVCEYRTPIDLSDVLREE